MTITLATEHEEQAALVRWLSVMRVGHFAVPNGARVRPSQARKMKSEGMTPGAPDLVLIDLSPLDGRPVAVEMKRSKGGAVSPEQKMVHEAMRAAGWHVVVGRGYEDAVNQLAALGFTPRWLAGKAPARSE